MPECEGIPVSYFELTLPLDHEWMPDEVFPIAARFYLAPRAHPDKGIVLGSETGTCVTLPAAFREFRGTRRLHEVPAEKLFLRPTVVLDIPKNAREEITEEDVRAAFDQQDPNPGEAVLIRTGWGDRERHKQPGGGYILETPHFSLGAAELLASRMREKDSDLLLADVSVIGRPGKHMIPEWCSLLPRPGPWPSPEAQMYLHLYSGEKVKEDFAVELVFARAGIMTVKRLIHCGAISARGIKIIVSPLHIVRGVSSTCRVIAIEEP